MDRRLAVRRAQVAEERARRNLVRLFGLLVVVGVVAALIWLARSPFLSVDDLVLEGVEHSDATAILQKQAVVEGRPLLLIRTGRVEEALLRDPWVSDATIQLEWPTGVRVSITERVPAVWALVNDQWSMLAGDGTILHRGPEPDQSMMVSTISGEVDVRSAVLAEVAGFAAEIPVVFRDGSRIDINGEEATAVIEGFSIRLGRPVDLADKGRVAAGLIASGVEHGSELVLTSPLNPAVRPPRGGTTVPVGKGEEATPEDAGAEDGVSTDTEPAPATTVPEETAPITTVVG